MSSGASAASSTLMEMERSRKTAMFLFHCTDFITRHDECDFRECHICHMPADSVKPGVLMLRDVGSIVALFSLQDSSFRKGI